MGNQSMRISKRLAGLGLALMLWLPSVQANEPSDQGLMYASQFVEKEQIGLNLIGIAFQSARATPEFEALVQQSSQQEMEQLLKTEIFRMLPFYQPKWNRNLAWALDHHLPEAALQSLAEQGMQSDSVQVMQQQQSAIGATMRERSTGLVDELVAKVLALSQDKLLAKSE